MVSSMEDDFMVVPLHGAERHQGLNLRKIEQVEQGYCPEMKPETS